jgi:DNA processing protein
LSSPDDLFRDFDGSPASSNRRLSDAQRLAWLRLIRSENVGPATFRELLNYFGSAKAALEAVPELARRARGREIKIFPADKAEAEITRARKLGAELVAIGEPGYPSWLQNITPPPPLLYIMGRPEILSRPIVSIVGSRNCSAISHKFTRKIAGDLGREGYVVASGLARGIDTAAHVGALEHGTIAVLAGGIDVCYPASNTDLQREIGTRGLLISESPPGLKPVARDFPRRNRIVSGIAAGVLVVEAAFRSGSLITARMAAEQGREVFAVPGFPLDPRSEGANKLIKNGATMVTGAADIIETLAPILGRADGLANNAVEEQEDCVVAMPVPDVEQSARARVISLLGPVAVEVDEIIRQSGLGAREVQVVLLELDLDGRLVRQGQQHVALAGS